MSNLVTNYTLIGSVSRNPYQSNISNVLHKIELVVVNTSPQGCTRGRQNLFSKLTCMNLNGLKRFSRQVVMWNPDFSEIAICTIKLLISTFRNTFLLYQNSQIFDNF